MVIVTAHLDSINLQGGPAAPAPGADDNASGSAGLLEIARAFKDHQGANDLRFILFGGEEQGLFGSKRYIATLSQAERKRIEAVVNMDMVGSLNNASPAVLLEGAAVSQSVMDGLRAAAETYTQLNVESSLNPFASDHVPFINAGVPAVLTIEGADSTNDTVHSANGKLEQSMSTPPRNPAHEHRLRGRRDRSGLVTFGLLSDRLASGWSGRRTLLFQPGGPRTKRSPRARSGSRPARLSSSSPGRRLGRRGSRRPLGMVTHRKLACSACAKA